MEVKMADEETVFNSALVRALSSVKENGFALDLCLKAEQRLAIRQLYDKKDLMAILPTGFGKSMIFQLLVVMAINTTTGELEGSTCTALGSAVIIICPLVGIINDQIQEAKSIGLKACNLAELLDDLEFIETTKYNLVFASAEVATDPKFLDFMKKNPTFCRRLLACVVDESHTVYTWSGLRTDESKKTKEGRRKASAFRGVYGQLSLLRSFFVKGTPMAALTGTADAHTQKIICSQLALRDPLIINISPNRENLRFSVMKTKKDEMFSKLEWLINNIKLKGGDSEKTIIFCNTMNDITCVVNYLMLKLGKAAYSPHNSNMAEDCLLGIYHSTSWQTSKDLVTKSLKGQGKVRVVIASTALSMGVNFPDVRYIINWGPARNLLDQHQEAGRAGRDGLQSHVVIVYHGQQLSQCEQEVKDFVKTNGCLRVAAYKSLDNNISPIKPGHVCCTFCNLTCNCDGKGCSKERPLHEHINLNTAAIVQARLSRPVIEKDREDLKEALNELGERMHATTSAVFDKTSSHGFSDQLIEDVVRNCHYLFTTGDILESCPVYSVNHALKILEILQEIFLDIPNFDETIDILKLGPHNSISCENLDRMLEEAQLLDYQSESSDEFEGELPEVLRW